MIQCETLTYWRWNMSKIFITGISGMLGTYVLQSFAKSNKKFITLGRDVFNLHEPSSCYGSLIKLKPNIILHMAAETDVDLCEREPQVAARRNALSTQAIARAAKDVGAYLVYISTSNIFSSPDKLIFNEMDIPNPCNYYGKSKLYGEHSLVSFGPADHLVVRAGWMIGGGREKDHKFVGKIVKSIESGANELKAVNDRIGSITYAESLASFIDWAIDNRLTGVFHYASVGAISRYEIALEIATIMNYSGNVTAVASSLFPLSAPRPLSDAIESIYLPTLSNAPMPGQWRDDIGIYVREFM